MRPNWPHWRRFSLIFAATVFGSGILLPFLREQPHAMHSYVLSLHPWQQIATRLIVATLFCAAAFKLLRPNPKHLYCCLSYPPAWLAAIIGTLSVAVFDVSCGLALTGYRATLVDWVLYGAVPFGLTAIYYSEPTAIISFVRAWTSGWFCQAKSESVSLTRNDGSSSKPDGEDQIPWAQVEAWLEAERPAQHDFFHRLPIAQRLNTLIDEGVRSIGLVGPFGSGKSSIIEWLLNDLRTNSKFIVIKHSCWGFETSESAIRDILDSAVGEISQTVDTFDIASLPETYRNTFSSAGVAASSFSVILLSRKDPIQQLWDLDQILMNLGKSLLVVIEDLDRNRTKNFEIGEVAAMLQRLNKHKKFCFLLTGDLSCQDIDFARLCDHIEHLPTIRTNQLRTLILQIRARCLQSSELYHGPLLADQGEQIWSEVHELVMQGYQDLSVPQAVLLLLANPRALRHSLSRTYRAWRELAGEVDWNHLFLVNVLRFGAPEAFNFLLRNRGQLNARSDGRGDERRGADPTNSHPVLADWNRISAEVGWNVSAATRLIEHLFPNSRRLFVGPQANAYSRTVAQSVTAEKYWLRTINGTLTPGEIGDQEVIKDIRSWLQHQDESEHLVRRLISSARYSETWEDIAGRFFAERPDEILMLNSQILNAIMALHGPSATAKSAGFIELWRFANGRVPKDRRSLQWLVDRIQEAFEVSLQLAVDLVYYYGSDARYGIISNNYGSHFKRHLLDCAKKSIQRGEQLAAIYPGSPTHSLYHLVCGARSRDVPTEVELAQWAWLGPVCIDALDQGHWHVATAVAHLIADQPQSPVASQDLLTKAVLAALFSDRLVDLQDGLRQAVPHLESPQDQAFVNIVVESLEMMTQEAGTISSSEGDP